VATKVQVQNCFDFTISKDHAYGIYHPNKVADSRALHDQIEIGWNMPQYWSTPTGSSHGMVNLIPIETYHHGDVKRVAFMVV